MLPRASGGLTTTSACQLLHCSLSEKPARLLAEAEPSMDAAAPSAVGEAPSVQGEAGSHVYQTLPGVSGSLFEVGYLLASQVGMCLLIYLYIDMYIHI